MWRINNMFKILFNELKRSYRSVIIIFSIVTILLVILGLFGETFYLNFVRSYSEILGPYLAIVTIMLVVYNFSYNKSKVSCDLNFSLPVSKIKLYIAKYLLTIGEILVLGIVISLLTNAFIGIRYYDIARLDRLNLYNLLSIFACLGLASFSLPFYYFANSKGDGNVYLILGYLMLPLAFVAILNLSNNANSEAIPGAFALSSVSIPFSLGGMMGSFLKESNDAIVIFNGSVVSNMYISMLFLNFVPFIASLFFIKRDKIERVEQVDSKIFGYKVFIPILFASLTGIFRISLNVETLIYYIIILIAMYIFYGIYRKSFKIKLPDLITMGAMLIYMIIVGAF